MYLGKAMVWVITRGIYDDDRLSVERGLAQTHTADSFFNSQPRRGARVEYIVGSVHFNDSTFTHRVELALGDARWGTPGSSAHLRWKGKECDLGA